MGNNAQIWYHMHKKMRIEMRLPQLNIQETLGVNLGRGTESFEFLLFSFMMSMSENFYNGSGHVASFCSPLVDT